MTFPQFLKTYNLNESSLKRLRHRLVLVGRFNQSARGNDPQKFLFTTRPLKGLSATFKKIFGDQVYKLDYKNFVQALRPALAESIEWVPGIPNEIQHPRIRTKVPRSDTSAPEGTAVVDLFHYLFLRAISTTEIEDLKRLQPNLELVLENVGSTHPGKGIFTLIREKLKDFAVFQPRTYLIIDAFSNLLAVCSQQNDMPPYAHGGALPAGFSEKLLNFVYGEDYTAKFSLESVDTDTPPWTQLRDNKDSREMFANVVAAFRDRLLGLDAEQFGSITFRHIPLDDQARTSIELHKDKNLARDFRKARNAFNALHQVLRDKALISMVLQWLLESYYKLEEVPRALSQNDKDEFVAERILRTGKAKDLRETQIADPVIRADKKQRDAFSASLTANLDLLITLALEGDDTFASSVNKAFPVIEGKENPLARAAKKLRENKALVDALKEITKSVAGADTRKAFVGSAKSALLTVICPILYEMPILTDIDAQDIANFETQRALMTAILLSQSNKQAIASFGRSIAGFFKGKIDKETRTITDAVGIQESLLVEYIQLLASGEIKDQLINGKRFLEAAATILRNLPAGGAGDISATRPDDRAMQEKDRTAPSVRAVQRTELTPATAESAIKQMMRVKIKSDSRFAGNEEGKASSAGSGKTAGGDTKNQSDTSSRTDSPAQDPPEVPGGQYIEDAVNKGADEVLKKFFAGKTGEKPTLNTKVVEELTDEASGTVFSDESVMKGIREDLKAYQQILFVIYQRYSENVENPIMADFTNPIDRMTLANMLLLYRSEMGLGSETSNLHALLIDMVENVNRDGSNIENFIKNVSLTRYFDQAKLEKHGEACGLTNLRTTLEAQVVDNLGDTKAFVSELWGIRYLMEHASRASEPTEVIVFNCTASEFLGWLKESNLAQGSPGPFRCDKLVTAGNQAEESILPGLVYLTDSAFEEGMGRESKDGFLSQLAAFSRADNPHRLLLPPMCISTRNFEGEVWKTEGKRWAGLAQNVPAAFVVVGPSPLLNSKDDYFKTWLPGGYVFAAHFLNSAGQGIRIPNLAEKQMGRFRVIGYGSDPLSKTLERSYWPTGASDRYGFAADYLLFIMLAVRFAAESGAAPVPKEEIAAFYTHFFRPQTQRKDWEVSADTISPFLISKRAGEGRSYSFTAPPADSSVSEHPWRSEGLLVAEVGLDKAPSPTKMSDIEWFNLIRERMSIDGWEVETQSDDQSLAAQGE